MDVFILEFKFKFYSPLSRFPDLWLLYKENLFYWVLYDARFSIKMIFKSFLTDIHIVHEDSPI